MRPKLFPPKDKARIQNPQLRKLTIKTTSGPITVQAYYGRDRKTGKWVMPLRKRLGIHGHQAMSHGLESQLCYLATAARSYEKAAEAAGRQGIVTDDAQIQRVVQQVGERAKAQAGKRVEAAFNHKTNKDIRRQAALELKDAAPFVMVVMTDGAMLRSRGKDWGLKPSSAPGERVAWHELKAGLVLRLSAAPGDAGRELARYYVATDGDSAELGRHLYAKALRHGLEQAEWVYFIADGAAWIWNVAEEHFPGSVQALDFYHASEHIWALARALHDDNEEEARRWVEPVLRSLKHGGGKALMTMLDDLGATARDGKLSAGKREALEREAAYFGKHASRLDYHEARDKGVPIGSGSMESACKQLQGRFKCAGQFWSLSGEQNLLTLELAWRNRDWYKIWAECA